MNDLVTLPIHDHNVSDSTDLDAVNLSILPDSIAPAYHFTCDVILPRSALGLVSISKNDFHALYMSLFAPASKNDPLPVPSTPMLFLIVLK